MTIAVIWQEDGRQWCVADTRLVAGSDDEPTTTTEIAAKIYAIPVLARRLDIGFNPQDAEYRTQYGFVYAGAVLPATMTAVTASTLLQTLAHPPEWSPSAPEFEKIAEFIRRLAEKFMKERLQFGGAAIFSAAFFGWCMNEMRYKLAYIDGRDDAGGFRVELSYPPAPEQDGDPWLMLGSGAKVFASALANYRNSEKHIVKRVPRRVIEKMVAEGPDPSVGGATSIGTAHQSGFQLFYAAEPITPGKPQMRRIFNGLDLDTEIGHIGQYLVAISGLG